MQHDIIQMLDTVVRLHGLKRQMMYTYRKTDIKIQIIFDTCETKKYCMSCVFYRTVYHLPSVYISEDYPTDYSLINKISSLDM